MKIKKGYVVRTVAGESVVVAVGEASKNLKGYIKLNDSGRTLWDKLVDGAEKEELLGAILSEYKVDEQTARADIDRFIEILKGANILE